MRESKAELTDRLRSEGRWDEFVRRREALKADGTPAGEAWRIAAAEFEPVPDAASTARNGGGRSAAPIGDDGCDAGPDLAALRGKAAVPTLDAVRWAFETIDASVTPADAPSGGAWSLRTWARTNAATRSQFYGVFVPKLLPNRADIDDPVSDDDPLGDAAACDAGVDFIQRLARAVLRDSLQDRPEGFEAEFDVSGVDVERLLAESEAMNGLPPSDGAETPDGRSGEAPPA